MNIADDKLHEQKQKMAPTTTNIDADYDYSSKLHDLTSTTTTLPQSSSDSDSFDEYEFDESPSPHLCSNADFGKKYVLRSSSVLGTGASSKVYLGSDIVKSTDVAIKVVDRSTLCPEEEERLVAEIEILREISHENILCESILIIL